ncbi:hypothetical protein SAMN05421780_104296 [Flexibacter flexilis DSM 6793]|uniref:Uncharacterized protein n=1 Tax=Flexibacter flexilis DSM 6793 TaxID=927664 RepID=A0A1I1IBA3_9BACT|nr:hypothetical protein [Flexibacter flexilis]SFC33444.1 hypothetical protein SAMN05421780_104296 [Flexibacter flexilis DSM 6793]
MTAKDVLDRLNSNDFWIKQISKDRFPFISKMATPPAFSLYKEVTVRIDTDEITRFGKPKPQRRRFDAIALVKPHYKAYGDELFTIGIEIKVSKSDLTSDIKYTDYIGYANYNFFAVPTALVSAAREKLKNTKEFGIINIDFNEIVKMPEFQNVAVSNSEALFREIIFNKIIKSCTHPKN